MPLTRGMQKPKEETTPIPSTPSAARLAAHAASKNPNVLKGTTRETNHSGTSVETN